MADADLINARRAAVLAGAEQFRELMDRIKDIAFNHRLSNVDLKAHWKEAEDPTDYMMMVEEIRQRLATVAAQGVNTNEGFLRALAYALCAGVSGYSYEDDFDVFGETARAYETRTELRPTRVETSPQRF